MDPFVSQFPSLNLNLSNPTDVPTPVTIDTNPLGPLNLDTGITPTQGLPQFSPDLSSSGLYPTNYSTGSYQAPVVQQVQSGYLSPAQAATQITAAALQAGATISGQVISANTAQNVAQLQATLGSQQVQAQLLAQQGQQALAAQQAALQAQTQQQIAALTARTAQQATAAQVAIANSQQHAQTTQALIGGATSVFGGQPVQRQQAPQGSYVQQAPPAKTSTGTYVALGLGALLLVGGGFAAYSAKGKR